MIFYCFRTFRYRSGTFLYDFVFGGYATDILWNVLAIFSEFSSTKTKKLCKSAFSDKVAQKSLSFLSWLLKQRLLKC